MIGVGNLSIPRPVSALPPVNIHKASPKAISGRTSYIRVRLEFLRYPHLIRQLFNGGRFGPPVGFTPPSTCPWIGHPVSGLLHATDALFTLGFPTAPDLKSLTSLHTITRRTILQKVPHRTHKVLCVLVNIRFQVLFHSPPGVLFTVPSQYFALSGIGEYLGLEGGPPDFSADSSCPRILRIRAFCFTFRLQDFHFLRSGFPSRSATLSVLCSSFTPAALLLPV